MIEAKFLRHYGKPHGLIFGYSDGTTTLYGWCYLPKKQNLDKKNIWVKALDRMNTREHWMGVLKTLPKGLQRELVRFMDDFDFEVRGAVIGRNRRLSWNIGAPQFRYWEENFPKKLEQLKGMANV